MSIETVFSSKGRVKILKILVEIGELNISEIARRAKLNYTTTNQHLQILETSGIVRHKNFGRIRIFRFNNDNPRAKSIKELIEEWNSKS
jgi:predicted transcriptional regulator